MSTGTWFLIFFIPTLLAGVLLVWSTTPKHERAHAMEWFLCVYGTVLLLFVVLDYFGWWTP